MVPGRNLTFSYVLGTVSIRTWTPGIVDGLAQAEEYAAAPIAVQPRITAEAALCG